MAQNYPLNTTLTPQEWYCRADGTICVKNWAGLLVIEYVPSVHARIPFLFQRLASLYNQTTIPYLLTDYNGNGGVIARNISMYIRVMMQNGAVIVDWGIPGTPGSDVAVRQIVFHTLPYRRDIREIIDTI